VAGGAGVGKGPEAQPGDEQPGGAERQAGLLDHERAEIGEGAAEQAQTVEEGRESAASVRPGGAAGSVGGQAGDGFVRGLG
jgi:hypothetical protein